MNTIETSQVMTSYNRPFLQQQSRVRGFKHLRETGKLPSLTITVKGEEKERSPGLTPERNYGLGTTTLGNL